MTWVSVSFTFHLLSFLRQITVWRIECSWWSLHIVVPLINIEDISFRIRLRKIIVTCIIPTFNGRSAILVYLPLYKAHTAVQIFYRCQKSTLKLWEYGIMLLLWISPQDISSQSRIEWVRRFLNHKESAKLELSKLISTVFQNSRPTYRFSQPSLIGYP